MIILGTIGNVFCILILVRKSQRRHTATVIYLVALSLNDLASLYTGLLRHWILMTFEIDIRHFSELGCKFHMWMVYNSLDTSAWILVIVTLERVGLVWLPLETKSHCNKKTAVIVLISVIGSIMLVNSHILYGLGDVVKVENNLTISQPCFFESKTYQNFHMNVWPWIDLVKFNAIPCSIISIGNIYIIANVYKRNRRFTSRVAPLGTHNSSKVQSLTVTLIALNTAFLVSTTPVSVYLALYDTWSSNATTYTNARLTLAWAIVNQFMFANNAVNFLLYCFTGKNFRAEVKRLFKCG